MPVDAPPAVQGAASELAAGLRSVSEGGAEGMASATADRSGHGSIARYRSVFTQVAVGIAYTTTDGRILEANPKLCEMLGYSAAELLELTTRDLTHPDDRDRHDHLRCQLIAGERDHFAAEKRYLHRNGGSIWVNRVVTMARDAANESPYLVQLIEDISARKKAEAQIERLRRARDVMAACHRILVHATDESAMLRAMCSVAVESGGYKQAWIGLVTSDVKRPVSVVACAGYKDGLAPMTSPAVFTADGRYRGKMAEVVATGTPAIERDLINDAPNADVGARAVKVGLGSSVTLPLVAEGKILGGFEFNAAETDAFDSDEMALLGELASDIAFGLSALRAKLAREQAQVQLRDHELRFKATFEQAAVGICHTSLSGEYIFVNRKLCEIFGYDEHELIGRNVNELTHPDDRAIGAGGRARLLDGTLEQFAHEKRFVSKTGEAIWTQRTVSLARDASGRPLHFIAVVEDISKRKELERRFQETFDQAAVGIVHTTRDGRYLQVNRRFCEMVGYSADELIGRAAAELTHPEDRDKGYDYRQPMWEGKLDKFTEEKRYIRKDGSVLWTNRTVSLARDAAGEPMYFIRVIEDLNEQKLAAQRRDMEHAITAVLAESPTLQAAMPRIIRTICTALDWACGMHRQWDESTQRLYCVDHWHMDFPGVAQFIEESRASISEAPAWSGRAPGAISAGLVRSVWLSGEPVWFADVTKRPGFRRGAAAARAGLHCGFGFPILAGDRRLGVMEFFGRDIKEPDKALLRAVQAIGRQLGQFIQRKQAEDAQRASEERYRDMFESSPLPMWVWDDATAAILTVNQAAVDHYGFSREEFQRMSIRDLWAPGQEQRGEDNIRDRARAQTLHVQCDHITKDRRVISVEITARAFRLGGRPAWLTLLNDITERLHVEEKLVHLAHYDTLTELPNRVLFYDRLSRALAQAKRNGWRTGVMFMDVDRFKNINDTLGHSVGDQLLKQVAERLIRSVRASDTVGRLGGDEFGIVLSNLSEPNDAALVAQKIIANFNQPFLLEGAEFYVTPSLGITLSPKDGVEVDELIKNADAAMYRAKEAGRNNYQYYAPEMSVRGRALVTLEGSLRRALDNEEFLLHYQPKADVATGEITGVEALLRWRRSEHGLVSPAEFIPVLEETGLIVQVGEWVLDAVCAQVNAWHQAGVRPIPVAVNLSARQFLQVDLGASIRRVLEAHKLDPALIEFEITESSLMVNPHEATRTLEYLKSLGVTLSIDDFGTGYSSLSYLKRFPINALKVDRSFVRDITTDMNDAAITLAVISMAHNLGLKVVAEGVETEEQLAFLAENGCDQIQGYYLAKPLPAADCAQAIVERRRLRPALPVLI